MVKTKRLNKTKRHHKKRKTIRRCKSRGGGFTEGLRGKTRRLTPEKERRRTITPNNRDRINRFGRNYIPQSNTIQDLPERRIIATPPKPTLTRMESPPKFRDNNGYFIDTSFGPSQTGYYSGPSGKYTNGNPIPHGKNGDIIYSTGHIYTGDFNKGKREGTGSLIINDGNIIGPAYTGEWKQDKFVPFSDWKNKTQKR